jgi:AcrR family transcriptional regulator
MPKSTFFNLPDEKRVKIEAAALEEFRRHSYQSSSINRIVSVSDIPKGSFYQYFENKKDLYMHIISIIAEKKLEYMGPLLQNPQNLDLFTLIRELFRSGIEFGISNPEFLEIGNRLMRDQSSEIYKELLHDNRSRSDEIFKDLLKEAQSKGEVRKDLDISLAAYLLTSLNSTVMDYYISEHGDEGYSIDILKEVDKLIGFIRYGIAERGEGN